MLHAGPFAALEWADEADRQEEACRGVLAAIWGNHVDNPVRPGASYERGSHEEETRRQRE